MDQFTGGTPPGGCNVLYMDGHVEFMRYPSGDMPCTAAFAQTIGFLNKSYNP